MNGESRQSGVLVGEVARAIEEQMKEGDPELNTWEKMKVSDAKRLRRIIHESDRSEKMYRVQNDMGKLMHHDVQALLSLWQVWHWDDAKGGWLDPGLYAKARREEVEYIR